jgi:hypothetical protein
VSLEPETIILITIMALICKFIAIICTLRFLLPRARKELFSQESAISGLTDQSWLRIKVESTLLAFPALIHFQKIGPPIFKSPIKYRRTEVEVALRFKPRESSRTLMQCFPHLNLKKLNLPRSMKSGRWYLPPTAHLIWYNPLASKKCSQHPGSFLRISLTFSNKVAWVLLLLRYPSRYPRHINLITTT